MDAGGPASKAALIELRGEGGVKGSIVLGGEKSIEGYQKAEGKKTLGRKSVKQKQGEKPSMRDFGSPLAHLQSNKVWRKGGVGGGDWF